MSRRWRKGNTVGESMKMVVIGCSGCGALAGLTAKKQSPQLGVTIIREPDEKGLLTRCATPYICCGRALVDPSYKDDRIFGDAGVSLVDHRAVSIDRAAKVVLTEDGGSYSYDRLVLAMGASAVMPPIAGTGLGGVFSLRKSGDATDILQWVNSRRVREVVVLGAGAVGIEEAYLLSSHGMRVTVVEMLDRVMPKTLDPDMSVEVQEDMRRRGLDVRLGSRVASIEGEDLVRGVKLESGETIPATMVIVSAGVRCNSELAEKAGLEMGTHGVKVNSFLQTSDDDIYAGGDLIEYPSRVTGRVTLGQLRPNAVIAGRVIAWNVLGRRVEYPALVNALCTKFYDKSIGAAGLTESAAREEGIRVVGVKKTSSNLHSMMRSRKPYVLKLVFDGDTGKLVGGQIVSDSPCPAKSVDVLALAIQHGLTALDLATFRAAGQPELSPDPGMEPIALAAAEAFGRLNGNA